MRSPGLSIQSELFRGGTERAFLRLCTERAFLSLSTEPAFFRLFTERDCFRGLYNYLPGFAVVIDANVVEGSGIAKAGQTGL